MQKKRPKSLKNIESKINEVIDIRNTNEDRKEELKQMKTKRNKTQDTRHKTNPKPEHRIWLDNSKSGY